MYRNVRVGAVTEANGKDVYINEQACKKTCKKSSLLILIKYLTCKGSHQPINDQTSLKRIRPVCKAPDQPVNDHTNL